MVGKKSKKVTSELENKIRAKDDQNEEFFETNEFLRDDESGSEVGEDKDDLLLEKLKSLDGKKSKRLRTEAVSGELDVNINSANGEGSVSKIKTYEILNSLKGLSESGTLKKVLAKAHKRTKVLETPLPKFLSEKAQRISSYLEDKKEVSKWDTVVQKNRRAEQLVFPLKQPDFSMQTANVFTQSWKPETDLEKQVAEVLQTSENNLKDQKLLTEAELKAIRAMNLDELKQKRAEFLKLKALQSYQEAKFKRLKHIKSKRYRKILKKERQKEEEKNMSVMEKEDPIKFKEVLENLQKQRIKERMSLKHKNTSKWAKKLQVYAKYDEKARDQIQEQLDLSKKLTTKLKQFEYNDSDDEDTEAKSSSTKADNRDQKVAVSAVIDTLKPKMADNPWLRMMSGVGGTDGKGDENGKDGEEEEWGLKKLQTIRNPEAQVEEEKEVSDKPVETTDKNINDEKVADIQEKKADETVEKVQMSSEVKINVKRQSDDQAHRLTLMEAFADDDIVEEFKTDKEKVVEQERIKPIDLTLPGWGNWAGADIDPNEAKKNKPSRYKRLNGRKRKVLIIHPNDVIKSEADRQQLTRKDKDLDHVIISEKKDTKLAEFQINELPRQFDSVADFESKIAKPIGRTWNPDVKFRKMIAPKVKTNMGSIIEPIDKNDVIKNSKFNKKK